MPKVPQPRSVSRQGGRCTVETAAVLTHPPPRHALACRARIVGAERLVAFKYASLLVHEMAVEVDEDLILRLVT